jgi:lipoprotein signal peptidase
VCGAVVFDNSCLIYFNIFLSCVCVCVCVMYVHMYDQKGSSISSDSSSV